MYTLSNKSNNMLSGVKEPLRRVVERAIQLTEVDFSVREGLRTVEQQRLNVQKGVSWTMNSKHITGDAVDLYPYPFKNEYWKVSDNINVWRSIAYAMRQASEELGIPVKWGGTWTKNPDDPLHKKLDAPHFELCE